MKSLAVLFIAALLVGQAAAQSSAETDDPFDVSQAALGGSLPNIAFVDTENRPVRLADFNGKPLVVSLVYTGCADVCPAIIESLYPADQRKLRQALGPKTVSRSSRSDLTRETIPRLQYAFLCARAWC